MKFENQLMEWLASIEHQRWADWQKYVHSKLIRGNSTCMEMHIDDYKHWERQIQTNYCDLSEKEKESDRGQVRRYLPIFAKIELKLNNMLDTAWGIIANAGQGNWKTQTEEWQKCAEQWRDEYSKIPACTPPEGRWDVSCE